MELPPYRNSLAALHRYRDSLPANLLRKIRIAICDERISYAAPHLAPVELSAPRFMSRLELLEILEIMKVFNSFTNIYNLVFYEI